MIKLLLVTFCVALAVQAITEEELLRARDIPICANRTGITQKQIDDSFQGVLSRSMPFKEFLLCLSKSLGFQNEAGEFQTGLFRKQLLEDFKDEKLVDYIVRECSVNKETPLETAFEVTKCYYGYHPRLKLKLVD